MREFLRLLSESPELFFENSFEEIAFQWNGEKYFGKPKGQKPFEMKGNESNLVEAILEGKVISKEQYENY
jgi:hypothetical protein